MNTIANNIDRVNEAIAAACARANRDLAEVQLVAISKRKPATDILAAAEAGLRHFGENRVEEASTKLPEVDAQAPAPLVWHMVGHVQSRKTRDVVSLFSWVHSVDSLKLAQRMAKLVEGRSPLNVLLQVNISGEESKTGFEAANWKHDPQQKADLWHMVEAVSALPGISVQGLMTMAPIVPDIEMTRPVFAGLAELREALQQELKIVLPHLSMGMTDDYPVAIEEGATLVRIGRAIFGERH